MKVTFFHLCDYAILSSDRKLSVMGIWSRINARKLPYVLPQVFLAFEIELNYAELGRPLKIEVKGVDADGKPSFGAEMEMTFGSAQAKPGDKPRIGQVIKLHGLQFVRDGAYDINVFINGNLVHQEGFEVRLLPQKPPPPPPGTPSPPPGTPPAAP